MEKWLRFKYMPISLLGKDGRRITGSAEHIALSRKAAGEGMILLKNEGNALPLSKNNRVALFGKGCMDYVKCGGGSGDVNVEYVTQFAEAMATKAQEGKVSVFQPLSDFYKDYVENYDATVDPDALSNLSAHLQAQFGVSIVPGNMPEPYVPEQLLMQAAAECDTAIISIHRFSTEGGDRGNTPGDGDFYLSAREQKMVDDVKANFSNIIVVLNVSGTVDCSWFADDPKVKGVLLGWQGGMEGASAQADILCGDVCPSGKLTDTLVGNFDDYPSSYNFNESPDYKEYTEDIFVGYRYFETVPGAKDKVIYPFGFGLSYTTFSIVTDRCSCDEKIELTISVTNTGKVAGKEVVQLYAGAHRGYLDTPALELRAFQKTKLLQPGETQVITLVLDKAEFASYDEKKAAYVLMQGQYGLFVGNSVRNITQVGSFAVAENTVTEQLANRCVAKKLSKRLHSDGTYEALPISQYEPRESTEGWPEGPHGYCMEHVLPDMRMVGDPTGDNHHAPDVISLTDVAEGKADMDTFLAQLNDDELLTLISGRPWRNPSHTGSIGDIPQYGIPSVPTADGPAGLRFRPNRGMTTTCWPVGTLIASTWDPELAGEIGAAAALELKENNIGMWLAPALNIHRNPQCGRNFEYFSEDPLITGKIAAGMVRGIQKHHIAACIKHFCCNNTEVNRLESDSIVSERAMREIYLKGFEIAVKEADPWGLMTCYNLVNGKYPSENSELLEDVLRGEWGFSGVITTDWANGGEQYIECKAGNDLRMPAGMHHRMRRALAEGRVTRADMLKSAKNILNFILRLD